MNAFEICLIAVGSVVAIFGVLSCCSTGYKKKQTSQATVVPSSAQKPNRGDVERGEGGGQKDGGMVILAGAGAAFAIDSSGCGGGCGGGFGGGGCGGGCGGGGCGGGGCGGGG
ncbi:hypothetical protein ACFX2J_030805 [Malus domestica]|nr:glycine-rich protein 5-like [Malus domestica]